MPTNVFFNQAVKSEQNLVEDLVVESLRMYGHNCYYLPRKVIDEDVTDDSVVENIEEVIEEPDDEEIFNQTYEFIQDRGDDPDLPTPWEYMIKMQDLLGWEDERMIQHLIDNGVLRAK